MSRRRAHGRTTLPSCPGPRAAAAHPSSPQSSRCAFELHGVQAIGSAVEHSRLSALS